MFTKRLKYYRRIFDAYLFKKNDSNLSFWHTELVANRLTDEDRKTVRRYPMNFKAKTAYQEPTDEKGALMLDYGGELGLQYNPNAIAQSALGFYELYLDAIEVGNMEDAEEQKRSFFIQADWFLEHGRSVADDVLLWEYNFPFEMRRQMENPWRSALAQGQALSVLLRAYAITNDERYLESAQRGYNAFRYECFKHEGGVVFRDGNDVWLEEYIIEPPDHILNGFIWALWGVWDYMTATGDQHANDLYNNSLDTIERHLDGYDLGIWTSYDLLIHYPKNEPVMPVSRYYQNLHVVQMEALYLQSGREVFRERHDRWQKYIDNFIYRNICMVWKIYFKLRYF